MERITVLERNFKEAKSKVRQLSARNYQLEEENENLANQFREWMLHSSVLHENLMDYMERTDEF